MSKGTRYFKRVFASDLISGDENNTIRFNAAGEPVESDALKNDGTDVTIKNTLIIKGDTDAVLYTEGAGATEEFIIAYNAPKIPYISFNFDLGAFLLVDAFTESNLLTIKVNGDYSELRSGFSTLLQDANGIILERNDGLELAGYVVDFNTNQSTISQSNTLVEIFANDYGVATDNGAYAEAWTYLGFGESYLGWGAETRGSWAVARDLGSNSREVAFEHATGTNGVFQYGIRSVLQSNYKVYNSLEGDYTQIQGGEVTDYSKSWVAAFPNEMSVGYGGNALNVFNNAIKLGITTGSVIDLIANGIVFDVPDTKDISIQNTATKGLVKYTTNPTLNAGFDARSLVDKGYVDAKVSVMNSRHHLETIISTSSESYITTRIPFIWGGSDNVGDIVAVNFAIYSPTGDPVSVLLRDVGTGLDIAEITGITSTSSTNVARTTTIANVPTTPSRFNVLYKRDTGVGQAQIWGASIEFVKK